jgi:hypothetical protein
MVDDVLVVISHYAARNRLSLDKLLADLTGLVRHIVVVINDDAAFGQKFSKYQSHRSIIRPNIGMNIGAWSCAYKTYPEYKYYIFLQDECCIVNQDFIAAYKMELDRPGVGLTGESINLKWDKTWIEMFHSPLNYSLQLFDGAEKISRVDYYLSAMSNWGIDPGISGKHLRSLVWGFNQNALKLIRDFPEGLNKEQCIAAEIAVSKKIESVGLAVTQISETPFVNLQHLEWRSDGHSKII